jgi:glycosyltransferase involved in cell wall biosynthesis
LNILHLIYDHIHNPWLGGGGAIRAYEIYRRLSARHKVTIVCGKYPGSGNYEEGNLNFHFVGTGMNNYPVSTFSFAFFANKYVKKHCNHYDAVIEDFAPWNPLFTSTLKGSPVLQIQNYLGKEILRKYSILGVPFYLIEKYYPLKFRNTVVVNESLAARYRLFRSYTIGNGIGDDLLRSYVPFDGDYIGYMGRIDIHQKGLDILSGALVNVAAKFKIAGDGRDRDKFLKILKGKGNAEWVGKVKGEEKRKFLSKASFIVVPSRFEGQGIVVLEAAACGKPVIVSDIPELRYAVDAGFGISFKAGDSADLAEKMRYLIQNPEQRKDMGLKARAYAGRFTWDAIAETYEAFLLNVIAGDKRV